jgi:multidrug efflux pump subunit AcrA (membrane-fusion protein)
MVLVLQPDGSWERRSVRTGARILDRVEVLAGLTVGETIGWTP